MALTPDAYVIGGGPAGLATAASLKMQGLNAVILDRSERVGDSWRAHYDRLHLHTPKQFSYLPGYKIPKSYPKWLPRDMVVQYLEDYAAHHDLTIEQGVEVTGLARDADGWTIRAADGSTRRASYVVIATGYNHTPKQPAFAGLEQFTGEIVMSRHYKNAQPFVGKDVLVVGIGNTGAEIAVDLVETGASRVRLAVRTIPHILRRSMGPWSAQHNGIMIRHLPVKLVDKLAALTNKATIPDLSAHGLPRPDTGLLTRATVDRAIPVQDVGLIKAVQRGKVEIVRTVERFDGQDVVLVDGSRIQPQVVLLATGYTHGLEPLIGDLGVLDENGRPVVSRGHQAPGAPGMWFIGFTNPISGNLRELRIDSGRIAHAMRHQAAADRSATA